MSSHAYHMFNQDKEIRDPEAIAAILKGGKYAILALAGADGPYIVTLSYGIDLEQRTLFFHTAVKGLKLDILRENPSACGTVIEDRGYVPGDCSHKFRSVVFYGKIREIEDIDRKKMAMLTMFRHLESDPESMRERFLRTDEAYRDLLVLELPIDSIRGKASL